MIKIILWTIATAAMLTPLAALAREQVSPAQDNAELKAAAVKQRVVKEQFDRLLRQMYDVSVKLEKTDPASAKIIRQAADHAKATDIGGDLKKAVEMLEKDLNPTDIDDGVTEQLRKVVEILQCVDRPKQVDPKAIDKILDKVRKYRETQRGLIDPTAKAKPGEFDPLSRKQDKLADDLDRLSKEIADAGAPGKELVSKGSKLAGGAGESIKGGKPGQAKPRQEDVVKLLDDEEKELIHFLSTQQGDDKTRKLQTLAEMLSDMLRRQKDISGQTRTVEAKRDSAGLLHRPEELTVMNLAQGESELADQAHKVLELLTKDGTTVVFPAVMQDVEADLHDVHDMLDQKQTDPLTQAIQSAVERSLQEMLAATQKELANLRRPGHCNVDPVSDPGGGSHTADPGPIRLVPDTADLKLLKHLQEEINHRTAAVATAVEHKSLSAAQADLQHSKLAASEKNIETLTRQMRDKVLAKGASR